jgi:hypothetical protein
MQNLSSGSHRSWSGLDDNSGITLSLPSGKGLPFSAFTRYPEIQFREIKPKAGLHLWARTLSM